MLGQKERRQPELFVAGSLRELLPNEHVLVRVDRVLDLGWLHDEVGELYDAATGRPSIDPVVAVRLMLAGLLLGVVHDRRLMREAGQPRDPLVDRLRPARAACGPFEPDPDRRRRGVVRFRRIFGRTVEACVAAGKQHTTVDGERGVVLDIAVTTGSVPDTMTVDQPPDAIPHLTGRAIQTVTMDAAYAITRVFAGLEQRAIEAVVPAKRERPPKKGVIPVRRFKLDAEHGIVRCPRGRVLRPHGKPDRKGFQAYRARPRDCRACPLRAACVSPGMERPAILLPKDHPALLRARRKRLRRGAREHGLHAHHRGRVEGLHGEAKTWHGLARATRRGLANMRIQAYLTAAVINLKRLAAAVLVLILAALGAREQPAALAIRDRRLTSALA